MAREKEPCIPAKSGGERSSETHRELDNTVRHSETSLGCTLLNEDHADSKPTKVEQKKSIPSKPLPTQEIHELGVDEKMRKMTYEYPRHAVLVRAKTAATPHHTNA